VVHSSVSPRNSIRFYDAGSWVVVHEPIVRSLIVPVDRSGATFTATKILWGQIVVIFAIVLATLWAATQWTAWRLGFQPQLGAPWFEVAGTPVYVPVIFFWWWYHYDAYAPRIFIEGAGIAVSGGFASIGIAIGMSVWRAREAKTITTYGSARWATKDEIRRAGLLGHDGLMLGRFARDYLRHDGPEHVLCFAPTRSGKGVGLVIPTLLTWPGSAIVHDIKGENWQLTAGWRARFGRALLFDPTNPGSAAYNPLLEVRRGDTEVRDVQNVADILVDPEGALERRNHWEKTQPFAAGRRDPPRSLRRSRQDPCRRRQLSFRPQAPNRDYAARHDDDATFWRSAASRRRFRRTRAPEQVRERALRRPLDRNELPRALPRSGRWRGDVSLRLANRRPRRR
jgi:Type IV secretory system Conjugative DNA transfer